MFGASFYLFLAGDKNHNHDATISIMGMAVSVYVSPGVIHIMSVLSVGTPYDKPNPCDKKLLAIVVLL
uniref:Uncharacterized protein n=1 Tax=Arundo donax TaxID=35708 RepID=A0A0A9A8B9_ARUDO